MLRKLKQKFLDWLFERGTISIGEFHTKFLKPESCEIYDGDDLKFIEEQDISLEDIYVESEDNVYIKVHKSLKTVPYEKWDVQLEDGYNIQCADKHILMDAQHHEIYCKDLEINKTKIKTKGGDKYVKSVENTGIKENMYDLELSNQSNHTYYTNDILSHNTTTASAFMLLFTLFNKDKTVAIVANKQATSKEILDRIKLMYDYLPMWLKPGILEWNKGSIKFDNGCKIIAAATSSDSIRGQAISLLYLDEFAFIPKNLVNEFIESTFPVISSSKLARIIITSTPNGKNHFYRFYEEARLGKSTFKSSRINWNDVPGRDAQWRIDQIKELGSVEKFNQEYGAEFADATNMVFKSETLKHIETVHIEDPLYTDVKKLEGLCVFERPIKGSKYAVIADVGGGKGRDASTFMVIDITTNHFNIVATYQSDEISTHDYPNVIYNLALYYYEAFIVIENNGLGDGVANDLWFNFEYTNIYSADFTKENKTKKTSYTEIGIKTNKKNKKAGVQYLRHMLDTYQIIIPDLRIVEELYTFIQNPNGTYSASTGNHDDFVMNLVLFAYLVKTKESFEMLRASYTDFGDDNSTAMDNVLYVEGSKHMYHIDQANLDADEFIMNILFGDKSTDFESQTQSKNMKRSITNRFFKL